MESLGAPCRANVLRVWSEPSFFNSDMTCLSEFISPFPRHVQPLTAATRDPADTAGPVVNRLKYK